VCGLQLKNFDPPHLVDAMGSVAQAADGYFIFTSYSLWQAPSQLTGPYVLAGRHADYWEALGVGNSALDLAAVSGRSVVAPVRLALAAPRPNPTRGATRIRFRIAATADVTVRILDVGGREVRAIDFPALSPGRPRAGLGRARRRRRGGIRRLLRAGRSAGRDPDGATRAPQVIHPPIAPSFVQYRTNGRSSAGG